MKKILSGLLCATLIFSTTIGSNVTTAYGNTSYANQKTSVMYNGVSQNYNPIIKNGTSYVQARQLVENMFGGKIEYIPENSQIKVTINGDILIFTPNSSVYTFNGQTVVMNKNPQTFIQNGVTYVPIRFIAEAFGMNVSYNNTTKSISIINGIQPITLDTLYNAINSNSSVDDVALMFGITNIEKSHYAHCEEGTFDTLIQNYPCKITYSYYYTPLYNQFEITFNDTLSNQQISNLFNVTKKNNKQEFIWNNKLSLTPVNDDSKNTDIIIKLNKNYLQLSQSEQKNYIATGEGIYGNPDNLYYLEPDAYLKDFVRNYTKGEQVAMYEYVDEGGSASDCLYLLSSDGTVVKYYADNTYSYIIK